MKSYPLGDRARLVERILFVEGVTRSGKFLVSNVLSGISNVEHFQYHSIFEHVPFLESFGKISRETATSLLQVQFDNTAYDLMVGRGLNFRLSDKSSVVQSPRFADYLQRCLSSDDTEVMAKLQSDPPYLPYVMHEVLPFIDLFFSFLPELRVVRLDRHPLDLCFSWLQRGWGGRWGTDPKGFVIPFKKGKGLVPWFALDWAEDYADVSAEERVVRSIATIAQRSEDRWTRLAASEKEKVFQLRYEDLVVSPDAEVDRLAKFLQQPVLPSMEMIKKREKLPGKEPSSGRTDRREALAKGLSKKTLNVLDEMSQAYEAKARQGHPHFS